jgi:hypothetical protein
MRRIFVGIAALCIWAALMLPAVAGTTAVYPPNDSPLGTDHSTWEGAYQVWMTEIPRGRNPIYHPESPLNCETVEGVVFLGPTGAHCEVPAGTPAAFSVGTGFWECSTAEGLGETYHQLRRCATRRFARDINADVYHQRVVIDGERLSRDRRWIFLTPGEIIDFPEKNIWHAEPGPSKSVTKGFFFILQPLDPGLHTIRVRVRDEVIGKFRFVWKLDAVT